MGLIVLWCLLVRFITIYDKYDTSNSLALLYRTSTAWQPWCIKTGEETHRRVVIGWGMFALLGGVACEHFGAIRAVNSTPGR